MSFAVNCFSDENKLNYVLDDMKYFHILKGKLCNELLNFSVKNDRIADELWHNRALTMLDCGTFVEWDEIDNRISHANFCRLRCCPMCQKRRSLEIYSKLKKNTEQMFGYCFLHVVLTCQNCYADDLSDRITQMIVASRKLFNKKRVKQGFKGVARFLEVTYNSADDNYHPHFHCLVMVKPSYFKSRYYIKNELLQELWSECMKECCLTHVKRADEGAFAEVAKYCVKPFDFDVLDKSIKPFTIVFEALHQRRTYQLFGEFRRFASVFDILEADKIDDIEIINPTKKFSFDGYAWNPV